MRARHVNPLLGLVLVLLLAAMPAGSQAPGAQAPSSTVFPGQDWERVARPEDAGYSSVRLAALEGWLESIDTTAMVASVGGRILFEYGDISHLSYPVSVRLPPALHDAAIRKASIQNTTVTDVIRRALRKDLGMTA